MTNIEVIQNKISAVKKYLSILKNYQSYSKEEIEKDINIKGAVERYLYLVIQSAIDLAEAMVSYKELRKPSSFAEAFLILKEDGILTDELTDKMIKMTGFRNIITHDYADIDYTIVVRILNEGHKDIEDLITAIDNF